MPPAPLPSNETERLAALRSYEILDTGSEASLDAITKLAARLTSSPMSQISLIDSQRQWFKARHGLDLTETHRDLSFCAHALLQPESPLIVEDATADLRFQTHPFVTGGPKIRAYLGVPLVDQEGYALGTLCVVDRVSKSFGTEAIETMRTLAEAVTLNFELRRTLIRTRSAALTDPLTGLANRRAMMDALGEAAAKFGPAAVIAVDLDHFKEVNDGEGHAAGDALLRAVADRLREATRPGDLVGRVGGDEFVILLSGMVDRQTVTAIAERISRALHRPVLFEDRTLPLGATLGIAIMPDDVEKPELIMRIADKALIRAKQTGRGSIGFAIREDTTQVLRVASIVRAFDADAKASAALQGTTVQLQPILALGSAPDTGARVVALEALARWSHSDVGAIPPAELFAAIGPERTADLSHAVRGKALASYAMLRQTGLVDARIALNLSACEVCRADIALRIAEQVERAGLSLRHVEIEITEEVLLERVSDRTLDQLAALRGRGARLVLDDFGTGNSGLAQMLRLPLDGLKLDKQFIQRLGMDTRADEIVRATVSLGHSLGLQVVAEGIETVQQDTMVRAMNCDAVQGFLYARPMLADVLRIWLDEWALRDNLRVTMLQPKVMK